ncbi:MAG: hypothetical protein M1839_000946 [Geoglossum umbratile]|nr:MAG: hypothetical protein M1839_000946 [Geoglossum umbratile]
MDSEPSVGQSWQYRPLSPTDMSEIRIVKLYPAKFDEGIRCELMHLSLDEAKFTQYMALSYTWGTPAATTPILLKGKPFPVTRNLEGFLRHAQSIGLAIAERLPPMFRLPEHASVTVRFSDFVEVHISKLGVNQELALG